MTTSKKQLSTAVLVMLAAVALSIVLMIATPALFFNYGSGYGSGNFSAMGWTTIFGGQIIFEGKDGSIYRNWNCSFNWHFYITFLIMIVSASMSYFVGPKYRGFYIASAVIFFAASIMFYTSKVWLNSTIGITAGSAEVNSYEHLGIGPWAGAILGHVATVACIVEFIKSAPKKRSVAKK